MNMAKVMPIVLGDGANNGINQFALPGDSDGLGYTLDAGKQRGCQE